jgi:hypothetical protein
LSACRALCDGQVGAVSSIEASRLARNGRDWYTLVEFSSVVGAPLTDAAANHPLSERCVHLVLEGRLPCSSANAKKEEDRRCHSCPKQHCV